MTSNDPSQSDMHTTISRLIPYVHVADVERTLAFYALLGFAVRSTHSAPDGRTVWANMESREARIMFAQASGTITSRDQAVLFYLYCESVARLRAHLIAHGVQDGGRFTGQPGPDDGCRVVFNATHPFYMPAGEVRVHDPDGYVLLIGQLS